MFVRIFSGGPDYYGVCYNSVKALGRLFAHCAPEVSCVEVNACEFHPDLWNAGDLIVMPGGVCSLWDPLIGEQIGQLRRFISERGGKYLGVCAGAFYASSHSSYSVTERFKIERSRALSLVETVAKGPLFGIEPRSVSVSFGKDSGEMVMNGGGGFFEVSGAKILGRFSEEAGAIVSSYEGRVVLSHPHIEYCSIDPTRVTLSEPDAYHLKCFRDILKELEIDAYRDVEISRRGDRM